MRRRQNRGGRAAFPLRSVRSSGGGGARPGPALLSPGLASPGPGEGRAGLGRPRPATARPWREDGVWEPGALLTATRSAVWSGSQSIFCAWGPRWSSGRDAARPRARPRLPGIPPLLPGHGTLLTALSPVSLLASLPSSLPCSSVPPLCPSGRFWPHPKRFAAAAPKPSRKSRALADTEFGTRAEIDSAKATGAACLFFCIRQSPVSH